MKKSLFILMAVLSVGMAQAAGFSYLLFRNTAGTEVVFSVTNLTMTVYGNTLEVTNNEGSKSFVLTELASMQFAENVSAIEDVMDADAPVRVISLSGVELGTYNSILDAVNTLPAGTYVISNGKNAQKIVVK